MKSLRLFRPICVSTSVKYYPALVFWLVLLWAWGCLEGLGMCEICSWLQSWTWTPGHFPTKILYIQCSPRPILKMRRSPQNTSRYVYACLSHDSFGSIVKRFFRFLSTMMMRLLVHTKIDSGWMMTTTRLGVRSSCTTPEKQTQSVLPKITWRRVCHFSGKSSRTLTRWVLYGNIGLFFYE